MNLILANEIQDRITTKVLESLRKMEFERVRQVTNLRELMSAFLAQTLSTCVCLFCFFFPHDLHLEFPHLVSLYLRTTTQFQWAPK